MLSTLSMLSNHFITRFTKVIPLDTLVVDEASQIEIGDYVPIFSSFNHTLRKMCFIGDDKQCNYLLFEILTVQNPDTFLVPPFGQEDLQDLQSIFEVTHLRKYVLFLDIQCKIFFSIWWLCNDIDLSPDRMPPQIGDIISDAVYEKKLKSNPNHPITNEVTACYFVNILEGKEKQCNKSFMACFLQLILFQLIR
jgi:hypothetical protein